VGSGSHVCRGSGSRTKGMVNRTLSRKSFSETRSTAKRSETRRKRRDTPKWPTTNTPGGGRENKNLYNTVCQRVRLLRKNNVILSSSDLYDRPLRRHANGAAAHGRKNHRRGLLRWGSGSETREGNILVIGSDVTCLGVCDELPGAPQGDI